MISPAYGLALAAAAATPQALADCYGPWVGIRSNHVITAAGNFSGADGSSRSISSPSDKQLLVALRAKADLVVVDAATARREHYKLPSSGAALAIVSLSGEFSEVPAVENYPKLCILVSPTAPANYQGARHVPIHDFRNPLQQLSEWAVKEGLAAVLLEAGPRLSQIVFENGLVSHSALTITETIPDLDLMSRVHPFDKSARLLSVAHSEQESFTYWMH